MRNTPIILILGALILSSCLREPENVFDPAEQFQKELDLIDEYLDENDIVAETDSGGYLIRYVLHEPGTGEIPVDSDSIIVAYSGRVLGGTTNFDESEGRKFKLSNLIPAWRIMIPYLMEEGSLTLYTPSYYGYGTQGSSSIPPNSTLVFDITLLEVR